MFSGNATPKLGLPQWNPSDHPDFLTDLNQAFKDIDENATGVSEEIAGYPGRLEELEALTQSLNEDTQGLLVEMSSAQVAIGNLKTEAVKIDPMELQIQGLQRTVAGQTEILMIIGNLLTTYACNEAIDLIDQNHNKTITLRQVRLLGNIVRVDFNQNDVELVNGTTYTFDASASDSKTIWEALHMLTHPKTVYNLSRATLFNSNGSRIGEAFIYKIEENLFSIRLIAYGDGAIYGSGIYPLAILFD